MNTILERIKQLEIEAKEIAAEQDNINHMLSLVNGGRSDEIHSHLQRLQMALNTKIILWNKECDKLDLETRELNKLAS